MTDPRLTDPQAEDELRVLLARTTPRLAAPSGRMEQIRRRVRRRRRHTATAVTVGALAVGGLGLWPGMQGFTEPRPATPAVSPTSAPGEPVRFDEAAGLAMSLPEGWQALAAPRAGRSSVVYAAPQHLNAASPPPACGTDTGRTWDVFSCAPLTSLDPGTVVVAFELVERAQPESPTGTLPPAAAPGDGCRTLDGQLEYASAPVLPAEHGHPALRVSICVAQTPGLGESSPSSTRTPTAGTGTSDPDRSRTADVTIAPAGPTDDVGPALKQAQSLLRTVHFS